MAKKVDKSKIDMKVYKWMLGAPFADIRAKITDLRDRREIEGVKQGEVAKLLDVHQPNLSTLENATGPVSKNLAARYITLMNKILTSN